MITFDIDVEKLISDLKNLDIHALDTDKLVNLALQVRYTLIALEVHLTDDLLEVYDFFEASDEALEKELNSRGYKIADSVALAYSSPEDIEAALEDMPLDDLISLIGNFSQQKDENSKYLLEFFYAEMSRRTQEMSAGIKM